uniref:Uncharacterized protein n=1 Tax=Arundo donax TaxID=35708 RepID=A0A0A9HQD4_ARUDO
MMSLMSFFLQSSSLLTIIQTLLQVMMT